MNHRKFLLGYHLGSGLSVLLAMEQAACISLGFILEPYRDKKRRAVYVGDWQIEIANLRFWI